MNILLPGKKSGLLLLTNQILSFVWCVQISMQSKHNGISVLLIDMDSQGVVAKPIELISGTSHFCEVFLMRLEFPKKIC